MMSGTRNCNIAALPGGLEHTSEPVAKREQEQDGLPKRADDTRARARKLFQLAKPHDPDGAQHEALPSARLAHHAQVLKPRSALFADIASGQFEERILQRPLARPPLEVPTRAGSDNGTMVDDGNGIYKSSNDLVDLLYRSHLCPNTPARALKSKDFSIDYSFSGLLCKKKRKREPEPLDQCRVTRSSTLT
jgi:hypothetical protein